MLWQTGDVAAASALPQDAALRLNDALQRGFVGPGFLPTLMHFLITLTANAMGDGKKKPNIPAFSRMFPEMAEWMGIEDEDGGAVEGGFADLMSWRSRNAD